MTYPACGSPTRDTNDGTDTFAATCRRRYTLSLLRPARPVANHWQLATNNWQLMLQLRAGIPTIDEVDALVNDDLFRRHVEFNKQFLARHAQAMRDYGAHWGDDPLKLWSRRFEYPFVYQRVVSFGQEEPNRPLRVMDAGSGVTYFPYLVCETLPRASFVCVDNDKSYHRQFEEINKGTPHKRVVFVEASLQKLPQDDKSFDAICCISVLEHTDRYAEILREFRRVLRPGGLLVLTFDLSLDDKFELSFTQAEQLLRTIQELYETPAGLDVMGELAKMKSPERLLSTDHVKRTEPELLPWKYPMLKGLHDLVKGKGWTGGFRSKSVFCLEARAKA
jgi:SAM-dependent methyltransferase